MDAVTRIETALKSAVMRAQGPGCPPKLAQAIDYAIFPHGSFVRPRLCLAVAEACGDDQPGVSDAAAAAIEMLHCASLVHDDLPCFDDADLRRGKPSVHRRFGEPLAVLVGDAMIVMAFQTVAQAAALAPDRLASVSMVIARSVGVPNGIIAGQAWESEPDPDLAVYQRAKTGSLFVSAAVSGAAAAGADATPWQALGATLGEAYQVADDLRDAVSDADELGKPCGQDAVHNRPNAVAQLGVEGAMRHLEKLVRAAVESIPDCPGAQGLERLILGEAKRLVPRQLAQSAA